MRPLIIDDTTKAAIDSLKKNAEENIITTEELIKMMEGNVALVGDRPGFSTILPFGYRVVFSMELQNSGLARHLSMSVNTPGKMPNPIAVEAVMKEFGFEHTLNECFIQMDHKAIYVMEIIDPQTHEKVLRSGRIATFKPK